MKVMMLLAFLASSQEDVRRRKPGWADLGVRFETIKGAATVAEVYEGSKAGLEKGDVVAEFDGVKAPDAEAVMAALWSMEVGRKVKFAVMRGRERRELEAATVTIAGQKQAGNNNWEHHPPAIRAVPVAGQGKALYAFDLVVSFDWDLSDDEWKAAKAMTAQAAEIFCDATEGQMIWRSVEMHEQKGAWERAHYQISKGGQGGAGVEHVTPGGQCTMRFGMALDQGSPAVIFAHEAGHMQLGSGDEYPYGAADPQEDCRCLMGRDCFKGVWDLCIRGAHGYREMGSCWENARRWYPNLVIPEKPAKGPAPASPPVMTVGAASAEDLGKRIEERVARLLDARLKALKEEVVETVLQALRK